MKHMIKTTVCGLMLASLAACGSHGGHGEKADHYFDKIDANGNGSITHVEMQAYSHQKLHKADANGDRVVSREEFHDMKRMKKDYKKEHMDAKTCDSTYPGDYYSTYDKR